MTHGSGTIIIFNAAVHGPIPEDKVEKMEALLEKVNKEAEKILDKNPNL